ncbi:hypothetical protein HanRHA438_Chr02g0082321 [Helianthus annuus]|nr:hypothetical protein HanRHA438_Chr02g0082321 [Helianthus annuus]
MIYHTAIRNKRARVRLRRLTENIVVPRHVFSECEYITRTIYISSSSSFK